MPLPAPTLPPIDPNRAVVATNVASPIAAQTSMSGTSLDLSAALGEVIDRSEIAHQREALALREASFEENLVAEATAHVQTSLARAESQRDAEIGAHLLAVRQEYSVAVHQLREDAASTASLQELA